MRSVEDRLAALERSVARWRLSAIALLGVITVLILGGADAPKNPNATEEVTTRHLRIVDDAGNVVIDTGTKEGLTFLALTTPKSGASVSMDASPDSSSISLTDAKRVERISGRADQFGASLSVLGFERTSAGLFSDKESTTLKRLDSLGRVAWEAGPDTRGQ